MDHGDGPGGGAQVSAAPLSLRSRGCLADRACLLPPCGCMDPAARAGLRSCLRAWSCNSCNSSRAGHLESCGALTRTAGRGPCRGSPLRRLWDPRLTFTGTSIMGINPATGQRLGACSIAAAAAAQLLPLRVSRSPRALMRAAPAASTYAAAALGLHPPCACPPALLALACAGKFNRHVDTWDAVQQQGYFSLEAFIHMLSQASACGAFQCCRPHRRRGWAWRGGLHGGMATGCGPLPSPAAAPLFPAALLQGARQPRLPSHTQPSRRGECD